MKNKKPSYLNRTTKVYSWGFIDGNNYQGKNTIILNMVYLCVTVFFTFLNLIGYKVINYFFILIAISLISISNILNVDIKK